MYHPEEIEMFCSYHLDTSIWTRYYYYCYAINAGLLHEYILQAHRMHAEVFHIIVAKVTKLLVCPQMIVLLRYKKHAKTKVIISQR